MKAKGIYLGKRIAQLRLFCISAILCFFGSITAQAGDYNVLVIQFADGTSQSYVLEERPNVTFDATKLYVRSKYVDDVHEYKNVKKFVFETHDLSGIKNIQKDECRLTFIGGNMATVNGLPAGLSATLCDTAGRNVMKAKADATGTVNFQLQGLPAGTYIIALSNGKSFKILKH